MHRNANGKGENSLTTVKINDFLEVEGIESLKCIFNCSKFVQMLKFNCSKLIVF